LYRETDYPFDCPFVPKSCTGGAWLRHYYVQAVLPDGSAVGRGELEIERDYWTYNSKQIDARKTVTTG
jgi:hypothetical protein